MARQQAQFGGSSLVRDSSGSVGRARALLSSTTGAAVGTPNQQTDLRRIARTLSGNAQRRRVSYRVVWF